MAVTFSSSDLHTLADLAQAHPSPAVFWAWVKAHTGSSELQQIAQKFVDDWTALGKTPIGEASRMADAVQELQAVEQVVELIREEDLGQGKTITAHVKSTTASV